MSEPIPPVNTPTGPPPVPSPARSGRRSALKWVGVGLALVGVNVVLMVFDGSYYPILMLFGLPALFVGAAGIFYPADFASANDPTPQPVIVLPGTKQPTNIADEVMLGAFLAGLALGIYLMAYPEALLNWVGMGGAAGALVPVTKP